MTSGNTPGLYLNNILININNVFNLSNALSYIFENVNDGDDYCIVLGADEIIAPNQYLFYSAKNVKITLLGDGQQRTISLASNGSMFTIGEGVTLTLGENIRLEGRGTNDTYLIHIDANSTLIMNDGVMICGNNNINHNGGAVYIENGTFTMNGGTINGNTASHGGGVYIFKGTFTMHGGIINNNKTTYGGGVFVQNGTFTLYDGKICENTAEEGGGVNVLEGTFNMHGGKICENTANKGGGVFVENGSFMLCSNIKYTHTGTFIKNPSGYGQNSGDICNNIAGNGGDVYRESATTMFRNTNVGQTEKIDTRTGKGLSANGNAPFIV